MNIGEEIVKNYLRYILECDFVDANRYTDNQGEMDVMGIKVQEKELYICEITVQKNGFYKTKKGKDESKHVDCTVEKYVEKFSTSYDSVKEKFADYKIIFMLWSPYVKENQLANIEEIKKRIRAEYSGIKAFETFTNENFNKAVQKLEEFAKGDSKNLPGILRFMQIKSWLNPT